MPSPPAPTGHHQNDTSTAGIDRTATSDRFFSYYTTWLHADSAISDDGDFTRTVHDQRSVTFDEDLDFSRSGWPGHSSWSGTLSNTGFSTADVTTTWTGARCH
jgi:hypothetical protein